MTPNIKRINHDFLLECVVKPWKFYLKTGTLTFGVNPISILYKVLTQEIHLICLENHEKYAIWEEAKKQSEKVVYKETHNRTEVEKIKHLKDQINLIGYDKAMDTIIKNIAYDISIKNAFAKFKTDNFDVEQYVLNWIAKDNEQNNDNRECWE